MFDYTRYLSIHKDLAKLHPKLQHDDDNNIAFLGDDDQEDKTGSRSQNNLLMMMLVPTGSISGDDDSSFDVYKGGFEIVRKMETGGNVNFRDLENKSQEAFKVGRQIIDRLNAMSTGDACDDDSCMCVLAAFDLSSVKWEKINYKNTHTGWRFTYNLGDGNINEYDETIWE